MVIKVVNEFKLTVFHLRAQTRCKAVHARGFTAGQQNCVGRRAVGRWPAFSKTHFQMSSNEFVIFKQSPDDRFSGSMKL